MVRRSFCRATCHTWRCSHLQEELDGTLLKGTFYEQDLQKVNVSKDDLFRVDKVVKRKGNKVLVRWKGWPDKYDSWIDKKDVKKL